MRKNDPRKNVGISDEQQAIDNEFNAAIRDKSPKKLKELLAEGKTPSLAGAYIVGTHPFVLAVKEGFYAGLKILCDHFTVNGFPGLCHQIVDHSRCGDPKFEARAEEFLSALYQSADEKSKRILDHYLTEEQKYTPSQIAERKSRELLEKEQKKLNDFLNPFCDEFARAKKSCFRIPTYLFG